MIDALMPEADLWRRALGTPLDTAQRSGINETERGSLTFNGRARLDESMMSSGPALDFIDIVPADSFLGRLRAGAQAAWEAYVAHDFVRQLAVGALPKACFQYYLTQDYQFLRQYARAYALAAYKAPDLTQGLFTLFSPRLPESVLRFGKAEGARCS